MNLPLNQIQCTDALTGLRLLPKECVHTSISSPPYYAMRDYGVAPLEWPEVTYQTLGGTIHVPAMTSCLGLEPTPEAFIGHLVLIYREVWRVLRKDGTVWLNIGDSYTGNGAAYGDQKSTLQGRKQKGTMGASRVKKQGRGLKPKDLIGIPWMLAFALRADGWYLRQDVIWSKPNAMPESVRDRCTKAHEYIFLLSKSRKYYFDQAAIAPPVLHDPEHVRNNWDGKTYEVPGQTPQKRKGRKSGNKGRKKPEERGAPAGTGKNVDSHIPWEGATANKRSVWNVATIAYPGAHFATFPPELIRPCILAGCPMDGVVLEIFSGAGTTAMEARVHDRNFIAMEPSMEYVNLSKKRLHERLGLYAFAG
jgi:DNA modification methylase